MSTVKALRQVQNICKDEDNVKELKKSRKKEFIEDFSVAKTKICDDAVTRCNEIVDIGVQVEPTEEYWTIMWIEDWIEVEKMEASFLQEKLDALNAEISEEEGDISELLDYVCSSIIMENEVKEENNGKYEIDDRTSNKEIGIKNTIDVDAKKQCKDEGTQTTFDESQVFSFYFWKAVESAFYYWNERTLTEELELELQRVKCE